MLHSRKEITPTLTPQIKKILTSFANSRTLNAGLVQRSNIILDSANHYMDIEIAPRVGLHLIQVGKWRNRFLKELPRLTELDRVEDEALEQEIKLVLSDNKRSGHPAKFTSEQITKIINLACTDPKDHGYEVSHWSNQLLADEAIKSGFVDSISKKSVSRFLKESRFKTS
jgi:hypothetical protein